MKIVLLLGLCAFGSSLKVADRPGATVEKEFNTDSGPVTLIVADKRSRSLKDQFLQVPEPVEIRSDSLTVKNNGAAQQQRRGRQVQSMTIDSEGVPVIEGIRVPDDPTDTKVYRNARVINNVLVTDEDNVENQIKGLEDYAEAESGRSLSRRQGRILTGGSSDDAKPTQLAANNPGIRRSIAQENSSPKYYQHFYNPDRAGLIDPGTPSNNPKEKVVTYSYSTSGGGIKPEGPKDVVYGSGNAAQPPFNPKPVFQSSSSPSAPSLAKKPQVFQPPQFWEGFEPSPFGSSSNQRPQQKRDSQKQSSIPPVKFLDPTPSSSNIKSNQNSHQSYQNQQFQQLQQFQEQQQFLQQQQFQQKQQHQKRQQEQQKKQQQQQQHQQQNQFQQQQHQFQQQQQQQRRPTQASPASRPSTPKRWADFQQKPSVNNPVTYSDPSQYSNSQPIQYDSHRRADPQRNGLAHRIPTPQEAFGENGVYVRPDVIPVSSDNFVIEHQTFQSHPGAPSFSIPVPRPKPVSQSSQDEYAVQEYDQEQQIYNQQQQQQAYYEDPYATYPYYYEEVDNRPIIEKLMDPVRRVGEKVKEITSPVFDRFRLPERIDKIASGTVDSDAIPLFAGAAAVSVLGALGAYAASKYTLSDISKLLPNAGTRSVQSNVPGVIKKLAAELESEEPDFMKKYTSSTAWLDQSCSRKMFCALVTTSMREEQEKLDKKVQELIAEKGEEFAALKSRQAREFAETDLNYLEKQMKTLLDKANVTEKKRTELRESADNVMKSVRKRDCSSFVCESATKKN